MENIHVPTISPALRIIPPENSPGLTQIESQCPKLQNISGRTKFCKSYTEVG